MKKPSILKTLGLMILLMIVSSFLWMLIFSMFTPTDQVEIAEPFSGASGLFGILTVVLAGLIFSYNHLRQVEASIGSSRSNIEITEKRNRDLMDKANRLVDKHRQNEHQEVMDFVKASGKENTKSEKSPISSKIETSTEFGQFIQDVPELNANQHVHVLLKEIMDSENNLQHYRMHYNQLVEEFNAKIHQFPLVLIKGVAKLQPKDYYTVAEVETLTDEMLGL